MDAHILRRLAAVSNFSPKLLDRTFEAAATEFRLGAGELLLEEGELDDAFLILVEGEVEIITGEPAVCVATVGPGEILGEVAVFGERVQRRATVRTRTPVVGVVFSREGMDRLRADANPAVARLEAQAAHAVCARLRAMNERISELAEGTALEGLPPAGLLDRLRDLVGWTRAPAPPPVPDVAEVLASSEIFHGLPRPALIRLAEELAMASVADGEVIIAEGTFGQDAWIVASGAVGVYRAVAAEDMERVGGVEPGQMLGMVGMLHGSARTATCIAEAPSWLLRVPGEVFRRHTLRPDEDARHLRRAAFRGLSSQLALANEKVAALVVALSEDRSLGAQERLAYQRLVVSSL